MLKLQHVLLLLQLLLFSSVSNATDKDKYYLDSQPSGAEVFDVHDNLIGNTPLDVSTLKSDLQELRIRKDGYEEAVIKFKIVNGNSFIFENSFLFCDTCQMETTGYMYTYQPKKPVIKLRKTVTAESNPVILVLNEITIDPEVINYGRINSVESNKKDKNFKQLFGAPDYLDMWMFETAKGSSFRVVQSGIARNSDLTFSRPKVILTASIKKIHVDYWGDASTANLRGPASIEVEWKFSTVDSDLSVIKTMRTQTNYFRVVESNQKIIENLFKQSCLDFLSIDTLPQYIKKMERGVISRSKGDVVKINKGEERHFETAKDGLKSAKKSVVTISRDKYFGSGFVISPDGYIITNYHVVGSDSILQVNFGDEVKTKAHVIKKNRDYDLALLKIDTINLQNVQFGSSENLESGDRVFAIGTPLDLSLGQTITSGIVSGIRKYENIPFIQTDVSINKGNSGGPLINEKGEVIGITTLKAAGEGIEGIGFCLPSDEVIEMLNLKFE
jgi:S1-C subfamily serine protease